MPHLDMRPPWYGTCRFAAYVSVLTLSQLVGSTFASSSVGALPAVTILRRGLHIDRHRPYPLQVRCGVTVLIDAADWLTVLDNGPVSPICIGRRGDGLAKHEHHKPVIITVRRCSIALVQARGGTGRCTCGPSRELADHSDHHPTTPRGASCREPFQFPSNSSQTCWLTIPPRMTQEKSSSIVIPIVCRADLPFVPAQAARVATAH